MQYSENGQLNSDYAKEWIAFLKRRNLLLTIVWPILLILAILSCGAAVYYYQGQQAKDIALLSEEQKTKDLQLENQQLHSQRERLEQTSSALNNELALLKSAREELSLQNNDSESKLTITSQMIENLKQLVAELKNERENLKTELEASNNALLSLNQEYEAFVAAAKKETIQSVSALNKQISSRKSAYTALANRQQEMREDMDRLSNLLNAKDKQLQAALKDKTQLNAQLKMKDSEIETYSNRLSTLQGSYSALESKLNAIMSPISQQSSSKKQPVRGLKSESATNLSGLEEIKKPVKPKQNLGNESFDHNKITVLP